MVNYEWWIMNDEWWIMNGEWLIEIILLCWTGFATPSVTIEICNQPIFLVSGSHAPALIVIHKSKPSDLALGVQTFRFGPWSPNLQIWLWSPNLQIWLPSPNLKVFLVPTRRRGNRFGLLRRPVFVGLRASRDVGTSRMRSHAGAWERENILLFQFLREPDTSN